MIQEVLLSSPLSVTMNILQQLVTFGASNFLAFLISYFVGLAISMVERPYLSPLIEILFTYLDEKLP